MTVETEAVTDAGSQALALVKRLVGDELASITSDVDAGRLDHVLRKLDQRGMFQQLIREQYSGRYPFELLQNANDAAAARISDGYNRGLRVRFIVGSEALLVADEGIGFGIDEVGAICGLGRSSKDPHKSIGYKGLGFKSVGEICETPQIITPDLMFGFDPDRVRRQIEAITGPLRDTQPLPAFAFPFLLGRTHLGFDVDSVDELLSDGFRTVLRLPYRTDVTPEVVADDVLRTIRPELLLFLPATGQLEVAGTPGDFTAISDRDAGDDHDVVLLSVGGREQYWHVFSREVRPPSAEMMAKLKDAWSEVEAVHVRAAVRLDSEGRPDPSDTFPLSVYFPTEENPGLPLLLQADFNLDLDRRFIKRTPEAQEYNTWLTDQLGRLVGEVVAPSLARSFPGDGRVIDVFSPRTGTTEHGAEISARVIEHLRTSRFIPCVDGRVRIPGEVLLLPESVPNVSAALKLMDVTEHGRLVAAYAQKRPYTRRLLEESLDVAVLEEDDALSLLSPTGPQDLDRLYTLLVDWSTAIGIRRFSSLVKELPFVFTRSGSWHTPSEDIYFPRGRDDPAIFDELPVEVAAVPEVDGADDLLSGMGVQTFLWRNILLRRVLPVLADPDASDAVKKPNWDLLRAYYLQEGGGDQEVSQRARSVMLPAVTAHGGQRTLNPAVRLYFSPAWLGHDRLGRIYGPFGETEFLASPPPEDAEERDSEFGFLEWLGVAAHPRVLSAVTDQRDEYKWEHHRRHPHYRLDNDLWAEWVATPLVQAAAACSQSHGSSQQLRASHYLDRIRQIVESADVDRLAALFQELSSSWVASYEPMLEASFYCQRSDHTGPDRLRQVPSLLAVALTTLPWMVTEEGDEVALVPPSGAWRLSTEVSRKVAGMVPALRADLDTSQAIPMCIALGVVDSARASSSDLIRLLRRLADGHDPTGVEASSGILDTARWVVGHLNDAFNREPDPSEELAELPLPTLLEGNLVFATDPYFCDDPELEAAWPDLPILHGGSDLSRLRMALGLRSLSDQVDTQPRPSRIDNELSARLTKELRQAAPYLAAVAFKAAPYRDETIFPRLARIEVVACEELSLSYAFGEVERPHKAATSYLLAETERIGSQLRTYGTAYLEFDPETQRPTWYGFGPQLAEHIRVPSVKDAFTMILKDPEERLQLLTARGIDEDDLETARLELAKRSEEPEFETVVKAATSWRSGASESATDTSEDEESSTSDPEQREDGAGSDHPDDSGVSEDADVSGQGTEDEIVLHPVDVENLEVEAAPHGLEVSEVETRRSGGGGGGSFGHTDWERVVRNTGAVGRWGEKLVYQLERKRVLEFGFDPGAVDWRSHREEFSPFDIRSLDSEGQVIFIEVKTTTQADSHSPFEISHAELANAFEYRERYHVYRVLGAGTDSCRVIDFDDPAGRLIDGEATFRFTSGRLYLAPPPEES
jgi:hypothetical protein